MKRNTTWRKERILVMMNKAVLLLALVILFQQQVCHGYISKRLIKDPLKSSVTQAQEEGAEVYVLSIDINNDGLNDVLIGENLDDKKNEFMKVLPAWKIYLRVQGGYKRVTHTISFNTNYIAIEDLGTSGTRVITFQDDKGGDNHPEYSPGDGSVIWIDPQEFEYRQGQKINSTNVEFERLFSNNYAKRIKTLSQSELNRFYKIKVFPAGRRQDYNKGILKYKDLPELPRTDPNSDTTGTLLTYGIILGNYTTSETLQLQAQAGGTSKALRDNAAYLTWYNETERVLRRRCAERDSLDWKTVEGHLKEYYANLEEDGDAEREARLGKLKEAVLEKSSDERIGQILVYIRNHREELGVPAELGEYGEEPYLRDEKLYLQCLGRLKHSPDCHKTLAILESIRKDLNLDGASALWYLETEQELRARCEETEK